MPFKVQVGPDQISIHQGHTVLVSETDRQVHWPGDKGLYFFNTRVISSWAIYANGDLWDLLNGGEITWERDDYCDAEHGTSSTRSAMASLLISS